MVELLAAQWTHVHVCLLVAGRFSYTKVLSRNGNFLALFFTAKAVALCRGMRGGGSLGKGDEGRGGGSAEGSCSSLFPVARAVQLFSGMGVSCFPQLLVIFSLNSFLGIVIE